MNVVSIEGIHISRNVRVPTYIRPEFYAVRHNLEWYEDFETYEEALSCAVKLTLMHGAILEDRTKPERLCPHQTSRIY